MKQVKCKAIFIGEAYFSRLKGGFDHKYRADDEYPRALGNTIIQKTANGVVDMNSYTTKKAAGTGAAAAALLLGAAAGTLISAALLCVCAAVFVKLGSLPAQTAPLVSGAAAAVGAFAAGWSTVKLCGSKGMLMGALSGVAMFAAVVLGSLLTGASASFPDLAVKCALLAVCGAAGGIARVNRRVKVKGIAR